MSWEALSGPAEFVLRSWARLQQRRARPGFHSRFGGLWTDGLRAQEQIERRTAEGRLTPEDAERLRFWMEHGYLIERGALAEATIDLVNEELAALWSGDPIVEIAGRYERLHRGLQGEHCKLVDVYALSRAAREAALAEPIRRFLRLLFDEEARLFQSLSFERGSEQPVHQDTAYVVVGPPLSFAAAWIALEDIRPGSGELVYYPGSHRLEDHLFRGGSKSWNRERDGLEGQERFHAQLLARAAERGLEPKHFLPSKGDILFWSADLAHGGSAIAEERATRKSLVCHYCPVSARPYYLHYRRDRRHELRLEEGTRCTSAHYDLSTEVR